MKKVTRDTLYNMDCPLDLAKQLEINPRALLYVTLVSPSKPCKGDQGFCKFPPVAYNQGYCMCCRQSWFPKKPRPHFSTTYGGRGNLLLGPEFQRRASPNMPPRTVCCCTLVKCYSMGYTDSVFYFPTDAVIRQQWYDELERKNILLRSITKRMDSNPRKYCLAWWHFSPDHLEKHGSRYKIKKQGSYTDWEGKEWFTPNHPPPNYSLEQHIAEQEEMVSSMFHSFHSFPWWTAMKNLFSPPIKEQMWHLEYKFSKLEKENRVLKEQLRKTEVAYKMELNKKLTTQVMELNKKSTKQVHLIEAHQKAINVIEVAKKNQNHPSEEASATMPPPIPRQWSNSPDDDAVDRLMGVQPID
jgi:hypothetical protein